MIFAHPLRTVVAYMCQGNKLHYHAQTNRYNFVAFHPKNLKLLTFCSVYPAENCNVEQPMYFRSPHIFGCDIL